MAESKRGRSGREESVHLPLKAVDFHILLSLADEELYGYRLVREIEGRSAGRVRLEPGNLYRYIRRLEGQGLVEPAGRRATTGASSERRRYYRLTALGRRVLAAEAARMRSLVAAVEARLEVPPA